MREIGIGLETSAENKLLQYNNMQLKTTQSSITIIVHIIMEYIYIIGLIQLKEKEKYPNVHWGEMVLLGNVSRALLPSKVNK